VVRGHNDGAWRTSRPLWTSMAGWLGHELEPTAPEVGYAALVERLLWTFGPASEDDIVWWLGSTKGAVRGALAAVEALGVELDDGTTGWVLPDDTADLEAAPAVEPWVALLPTLDPTTMGWRGRGRGFHLDPAHVPYLFDRAGNGGTTVWVDGRIVGCWVQGESERVEPILMEDISADARRRLDVEVARLDGFLRGVHITNVFASPQMKHQRLS
ncbi:MAG: crosslink repair DNA glycosylase YcaQ family protein, partial [Ilumatobacteraceae bacterium]